MKNAKAALVPRRMFLRGAGGAVVGLPLLESLPRRPAAQAAEAAGAPRFAVFVKSSCAFPHAYRVPGDNRFVPPEMFFPNAINTPLSRATLAGPEKNKACSVLADYADKLIFIKNSPFVPGTGGHEGGTSGMLTAAAAWSDNPMSCCKYPASESADNRIARELNPAGRDPLNLMAPPGLGAHTFLSWTGPEHGTVDAKANGGLGAPKSVPTKLRAVDSYPANAYARMMGFDGTDPALGKRIVAGRKSVNDLVKKQIARLRAQKRLSGDDRSRLDQHFSAIRDLEINMACKLPQDLIDAIAKVPRDDGECTQAGRGCYVGQSESMEIGARLNADLIALAFACGYTRVATLELGLPGDHTMYTVRFPDGTMKKLTTSHHNITHDPDGNSSGMWQWDAQTQIYVVIAGYFKHLLDALAAHNLPYGNLLDQTVAAWAAEVGEAAGHQCEDSPWVLAGSCGGYLKTGRYLDAQRQGHNKVLNTILNAVGVTKADGSPVDDFGDLGNARGEMEILKQA